jgi:hypothetical protein
MPARGPPHITRWLESPIARCRGVEVPARVFSVPSPRFCLRCRCSTLSADRACDLPVLCPLSRCCALCPSVLLLLSASLSIYLRWCALDRALDRPARAPPRPRRGCSRAGRPWARPPSRCSPPAPGRALVTSGA